MKGADFLSITEARKRANQKWDSENLRRTGIAFRKEVYDIAKAIADREGKSFNQFVVQCVEHRINEYIAETEKENPGT